MTDIIAEEPLIDSEDADFIKRVLRDYTACRAHTQDWRDETETCFDYVAGHQWSDEEKASMEERGRPPVTFNRTEVFVQAVCGLEALNRNEVQYLPRRVGPADQWASDLWNGAARYVNDDCDAEIAHSSAFRDSVICGMGWTESRMDYETNPDGDIKVERVDSLQMYWDHRANQRNLADAKWIMRVKPMSMSDIRAMWPDKADDIEFSRMFEPDWEPQGVHDATEAWKYQNDQSRRGISADEDEIWVAQYQWYEREAYYRVATPQGVMDFDKAQWNQIRERYPQLARLRAVTLTRRKHKQAFLAGWTLLEKGDIDLEGFTLQCITGKLDRNKNVWYGMVRPLKDPQDWANKLFSQILFILSSNAKGGLMAEKDAFDNTSQAERDWSSPDKIVWMNQGAISQGKIQQRDPIRYPEGQDRLMMFAMNMFREVTGANLELLGLAEKVQPGVLEAQRKQAGMTILSWAFDSLRAYRKRQGRILAEMIRKYLSDGRLIRITGQDGAQYIPLMRDQLALEYDIIVSENPQSPNEREKTFQIIMQLLPAFVKMGIGPPPTLLDYLPLPAKFTEEWKKNMQGDPQKQQMQQQAAQLEMAGKDAAIKKDQSAAALNMAKAQKEALGL